MLRVGDVMVSRVRTVGKDKTVLEAAKMMARWKTGSLIVTEGKQPIGIVTEGDISRAVARGLQPSRLTMDSMAKSLITISPDARVEEAAQLMANKGIKKLPVVEGGKLVGIITATDIVAMSFDLVTSLKEMVRARYRPPDFDP